MEGLYPPLSCGMKTFIALKTQWPQAIMAERSLHRNPFSRHLKSLEEDNNGSRTTPVALCLRRTGLHDRQADDDSASRHAPRRLREEPECRSRKASQSCRKIRR